MGVWQELREVLQGCETLDDVKLAVDAKASDEMQREDMERLANSFTDES